jgi:uncharacterized protein
MSLTCSLADLEGEAGLDACHSDPAWYLAPPTVLHGEAHAARVMVWANLLAHWLRISGVAVDMGVVRWSALLHDVRRRDDGSDPLHGERAAAWIEAGGVPALHALGDLRVAMIAFCCRWHVPPDDAAPSLTPELICLKDADALDRARLGPTQVGRLRLREARLLRPHAADLFALTGGQPWSVVRAAARKLDFWSPDHDATPSALTPRHACTCC